MRETHQRSMLPSSECTKLANDATWVGLVMLHTLPCRKDRRKLRWEALIQRSIKVDSSWVLPHMIQGMRKVRHAKSQLITDVGDMKLG